MTGLQTIVLSSGTELLSGIGLPTVLAFSWEDIIGLVFFLLVVFLQRKGKPNAETTSPPVALPPEPTYAPPPPVVPTLSQPVPVMIPERPSAVIAAEGDRLRSEWMASIGRLAAKVRTLETSAKTSPRWVATYEYIGRSLRPRVDQLRSELESGQETADSAYVRTSEALFTLTAEVAAVDAWIEERVSPTLYPTIGVAETLCAEWISALQRTASGGANWPVRRIVGTHLPQQTLSLLDRHAAKVGLFFVPLAALRADTPLRVPLVARAVIHMLLRWHPEFAAELYAAWVRPAHEVKDTEVARMVSLMADLWEPVLVPDVLAVWVAGPSIVERVLAPVRSGGTNAQAYTATATFDGVRWSSSPPPIAEVLCGCAVLRRNGLSDLATRFFESWQEKHGKNSEIVVVLPGNQRTSIPVDLVSAELVSRIENWSGTKLTTLAGYSLASVPDLAYSQIHRDDRERVVMWLRQGLPGTYSPRAVADGALVLVDQNPGEIKTITAAFLKAILRSDSNSGAKSEKTTQKTSKEVLGVTDWRQAIVDGELLAPYRTVRQGHRRLRPRQQLASPGSSG